MLSRTAKIVSINKRFFGEKISVQTQHPSEIHKKSACVISNKMVLAYSNFWVNWFLIVLFGVLFHVCDSYVLIQEGDIMIESSLGAQTSQTENVRSRRNAVKDKKNLWDFGIVPYEIDTTVGFNDRQIARIEAAMKHWENYTCIIFIRRNASQHRNFIQFTKNVSICDCCSQIGKSGGGQDILVDGCGEIGEYIHELGHAIGFVHEHQRPDRDDYVEIKKDNYEGDDFHFDQNFGKLSPDQVDTLDEPYDYDSIMHYYEAAESKFSLWVELYRVFGNFLDDVKNMTLTDMWTIVPKKKNNIVPKIGQRKGLSAIDIRKTNKLYKCPQCGRSYFLQEAAFTSPDYYNKSANRTYQCEWRITVTDGERIRLRINHLDIFKSIDCKTDYLEIRDGYWHESPLLGRFCGTNTPKHIVSTGHRMVMYYVSSHPEYRGFAANYEAFCENGKCPECSQTFVDKAAAFTSPEYHNKSTIRLHRCEWRIYAPIYGQIQLNITDLDIFKSTDCSMDYLEVRGIGNNLLGRFCGTNTPKPMTYTTSMYMVIKYISSHTEHRGFAANYNTFCTNRLCQEIYK